MRGFRRNSAATLRTEFQLLDARLQKEPWLAGEILSAADINLYPFLPALETALARPEAAGLCPDLAPIGTYFPGIARWMRSMEALGATE